MHTRLIDMGHWRSYMQELQLDHIRLMFDPYCSRLKTGTIWATTGAICD